MVEDELEIQRQTVKQSLIDSGYDVQIAEDGSTAIPNCCPAPLRWPISRSWDSRSGRHRPHTPVTQIRTLQPVVILPARRSVDDCVKKAFLAGTLSDADGMPLHAEFSKQFAPST